MPRTRRSLHLAFGSFFTSWPWCALLSAVGLALVIFACGGETPETGTEAEAEPAITQDTETSPTTTTRSVTTTLGMTATTMEEADVEEEEAVAVPEACALITQEEAEELLDREIRRVADEGDSCGYFNFNPETNIRIEITPGDRDEYEGRLEMASTGLNPAEELEDVGEAAYLIANATGDGNGSRVVILGSGIIVEIVVIDFRVGPADIARAAAELAASRL